MAATTVKALEARLTQMSQQIETLTAANAKLAEHVDTIDMMLRSLVSDNTEFGDFKRMILERIQAQAENKPKPTIQSMQQAAKPPFKPTGKNQTDKTAKPQTNATPVTSLEQYKNYTAGVKALSQKTGKTVQAINYATAQHMPYLKLMASLKA
ncbi:MAG: hypothetical protein ABI700_00985 [Chloroflexota bacterium]